MIKKRPLVVSVDLFQSVSAQCTVDIIDALLTEVVALKEYVIVQGQIGEQMYFVARGVVQATPSPPAPPPDLLAT